MCNCREKYKFNLTFDGTCACLKEEPLFKVGDKVYSLQFEWGNITKIDASFIHVIFDDQTMCSFTLDGRWRKDKGERIVFHYKPIIFIPAKPKPKIKKWKWIFKNGPDHGTETDNYYTDIEANTGFTEWIKLPWTEKEFDA